MTSCKNRTGTCLVHARPLERIRMVRQHRRYASFVSPAIAAEYARLPAGAGQSITRSHAIGVAFAPQRHAAWAIGGIRRARPFGPSAVFIIPADRLRWAEWTDVSESVEMWLDPALLSELALRAGSPRPAALDYHEAVRDPVVVNLASVVRAMLLTRARDRARLDAVALRLACHVLERYAGLRPPRELAGRLDRAVLDRVAQYIDAHLARPIQLTELAYVADRSPWHFAKVFAATTGSPPHVYLTARRMERALVLLQQTQLPIARIARLVGFESVNHFRDHFRKAWGEPTRRYRQPGRPRTT